MTGRGRCVSVCVDGSEAMMPTNLHIDDRLLRAALRIGGFKTKKAAVHQALLEFVQRRRRARFVELFGAIDWDPDYDYKAERSRR